MSEPAVAAWNTSEEKIRKASLKPSPSSRSTDASRAAQASGCPGRARSTLLSGRVRDGAVIRRQIQTRAKLRGENRIKAILRA